MTRLSSEKKKAIWKRDKECLICHQTKDLTVDHLIQLKDGGKNTLENLRTLCKDCHIKKDRYNHYFFNFDTGHYEIKIYRSVNI